MYYNTNPYGSYPYTGGVIPSASPGYTNQMAGNYSNYPQISMPTQQTSQFLNGKLVDSKDIVKATEVPIGSYGVFPKADFSEIYVKLWNNDGTTSVVEFKPTITQEEKGESPEGKMLNSLFAKIDSLEKKIDSVIGASVKPKESKVAKKEAAVNDY